MRRWMAQQLIERSTAGIFQDQHHTIPVSSKLDRSGSPRQIQLFSERIFVLQSFQTFRPGIFYRRSQDENPRPTFTPLPTVKDKLIIVPQHLEVVS
jgi:hypothetical protein